MLEEAVLAVGGTTREGQQRMADAVAEVAGSSGHLLVQAGTGTGKSLAYLVPALAVAVSSGRPVVISTATLALQSQIVHRDLPVVARAVEPVLGRTPTWQLVKGRQNYVCPHKVAGGFPTEENTLFDVSPESSAEPDDTSGSGPVSRLGRELVRLRDWAGGTETGDRDELVPGVSDRAWRQVSVSARECLGGQRCPMATECHSERARARGHEVDLVVTNHAFVAVDAFEGRQMLADHDLLIVDEGHELADRVTAVNSDELTVAAVEAASRRARRAGGENTTRLDEAAASLDAVLASAQQGRIRGQMPEDLAMAVSTVRDATRDLLSRIKADPFATGTDGARHVTRAALGEVLDVCERLLAADGAAARPPEGTDDDLPVTVEDGAQQERPSAPEPGEERSTDRADPGGDVVWISRRSRQDGTVRTSVHVAPVSVAGPLRTRLFGTRTVVLTSATLALGGNFDAVARSLGLGPPDSGRWRGLDVGSPFDYAKQGILYVARHLPPPGRDGPGEPVWEELAALMEAAGGRTLGLFSSRRAAELAAGALRERVRVPILCQGDDVTATLIRSFTEDVGSCLFGTLSLWQGVDVPGPSCQLVVIDRLPFPRPDDPLATARQEAVSRAGGNGFMTVAAGQAALLLAQGAGRLIRTVRDRGVVAVLDSRLATARYAGFLRASLPPFWTTTDREVALAALRRIDEDATVRVPAGP
jgi:ATP-dependent DNA helicase DinG